MNSAARRCPKAARDAITIRTASRCSWPAAASRAASPTAPPTSSGSRREQNRVSIHDLHATLLNQLGMDHTKLTYRYAGRDFRLTDVYGEIVKDILA